MKKTFSAQTKATVALEAIRGLKAMSEIVSAYAVHPTQVGVWRKHLLSQAPSLFASPGLRQSDPQHKLIANLYQLIGQRDSELEWLKKSLQRFDP